MSTKLRLFCAASVAAIAAAGPANAQSVTVSRDKMDALEAQINALQQELRDLKGKVGKAEQAAAKANAAASANAAAIAASPSPPPAPTGAVAKMSPGYQPSICAVEAYDGVRTMPVKAGIGAITDQNCIAFTSRLHFDVGGYNYHPNIAAFPPNHVPAFYTIPSNLDDGVNARRARIGVLGTFQSDWKYSLIYDMGGSSDGFTSSTIGCALKNPPSGVSCKIGLLPGGITSGIETPT
jgi:phosphate-selective porin OprO/OprP